MKNSGYKLDDRQTPDEIHNMLDDSIAAHWNAFWAMEDKLNVIHGQALTAWANDQMETMETLAYFDNRLVDGQ